MADSTIEPYSAFKLDNPNPLARDWIFKAYELPNGQVHISAGGINSAGGGHYLKGSRAEADRFFQELKPSPGSQRVELDPSDYPMALLTPISFDDALLVEAKPADRANRGSPAQLSKSPHGVPNPPLPRQPDRADTSTPNNHRLEQSRETIQGEPGALNVDAGDVALGVGKAVLGTALGIGIGVVAGPVIAAGLFGGLIFANFMNRYGEAVERGAAQGAAARALTAGFSDIMPVSPIEVGEALFGYDYVTGRPLGNSERSQILGGSVGGFGAGVAGGALAKAPLPRQAVRDATDDVIASMTSRENYYLRQERGQVFAGLGAVEARLNSGPLGINGGGDVGLRPLVRDGLKRVRSKTGLDPRTVVYGKSPPIESYLALRNKRTGLDANHLLLGEWFKKGPAHLRELYYYVPATPLLRGVEHQGTWHGRFTDKNGKQHDGLNEWLRSEGLFQKSQYSQKDIERGMAIMETLFRSNGPHEPWRSYADAIRQFRTEVFAKVKK